MKRGFSPYRDNAVGSGHCAELLATGAYHYLLILPLTLKEPVKFFKKAGYPARSTFSPQAHPYLFTSQTGQTQLYNFTSEKIVTKGGKVISLMVTVQTPS